MIIKTITLKAANDFVLQHHRHHKPVVGHKFSLRLVDGDVTVGVAIVGRPVSRHQDDGETLEVNRCCTDGTRNACSMLYGAVSRAAKALGYRRVITYTLPVEGGASLRGSGWDLVGQTTGGQWGRPSRHRDDAPEHLARQKSIWQAR